MFSEVCGFLASSSGFKFEDVIFVSMLICIFIGTLFFAAEILKRDKEDIESLYAKDNCSKQRKQSYNENVRIDWRPVTAHSSDIFVDLSKKNRPNTKRK